MTPRRFLFVMHYPGYLRYFDSVIRLLAARGHHVDVAFDLPEKQAEGAEALEGLDGSVEVLGRMPFRRDIWAVVARAVRGTVDYVRYLHPDFADSPYLRDRMRSALPPLFGFFAYRKTASVGFVDAVRRLFALVERAIPTSSPVDAFLRSRRPDVVLVTPIVLDRSPQVDVVKAAQALGIRTGICVASWDHLTTKGLLRVQPDLVTVWNEHQKLEAVTYHGADPERIVVSGADPFDRWFERRASDRAAFCAKAGLRPDRPFVLFVGSTASISAPDAELRFVRRWIEALRTHPDLADVGILVRPHPYNSKHWRDVEYPDMPNVAVYPRVANPVNEADRQDYFDSLHHSETVVGINTTAMIEAAIVGRTVHSVLADDFRNTQQGTLHFRYMLAENGGFLRVAGSLDEHVAQVAETLRSPEIGRAACARFVASFIRPQGVETPSTPVMVEVLERLAASGPPQPVTMPLVLRPLSALLWVMGAISVYSDVERLRGLVWKLRKIVAKYVRKKREHLQRARKRRRRERKLRRMSVAGARANTPEAAHESDRAANVADRKVG